MSECKQPWIEHLLCINTVLLNPLHVLIHSSQQLYQAALFLLLLYIRKPRTGFHLRSHSQDSSRGGLPLVHGKSLCRTPAGKFSVYVITMSSVGDQCIRKKSSFNLEQFCLNSLARKWLKWHHGRTKWIAWIYYYLRAQSKRKDCSSPKVFVIQTHKENRNKYHHVPVITTLLQVLITEWEKIIRKCSLNICWWSTLRSQEDFKTRGMITFGTLFLYFVSLLNKDIRKRMSVNSWENPMSALPSTEVRIRTSLSFPLWPVPFIAVLAHGQGHSF